MNEHWSETAANFIMIGLVGLPYFIVSRLGNKTLKGILYLPCVIISAAIFAICAIPYMILILIAMGNMFINDDSF